MTKSSRNPGACFEWVLRGLHAVLGRSWSTCEQQWWHKARLAASSACTQTLAGHSTDLMIVVVASHSLRVSQGCLLFQYTYSLLV